MIGPKDREDWEYNFSRLLQAVKARDQELWSVIATHLNKERWRKLLEDVRQKDPELFDRIDKLYKALVEGQETITNSPEENVLDATWQIVQRLLRQYNCETGLMLPEEANPVTVTVVLNIDQPVVGLPPEILTLADNLAMDYGSRRKWTFGFDNRRFVVDLAPDAVEELRRNPMVQEVIIEPIAFICEIPPYNPNIENLDWGIDRIHAAVAWNQGIYGQKIKVAVLDTGIKKSHPAFWKDGVCVVKGGWNFVGNNNNPDDDHDHGTYCAGIIAEQHNNVPGTYKGIAPQVELYACKVLDSKGSGSFANVAAAIDWARTNGMHIISMSLGGSSGSSTLEEACRNAWYAGLVLCAAAGNSGPDMYTVNYPARYEACMAVGAVDYYENVPDFSSRGPELDLVAPGRAIVGPWAGITYKNYVVKNSNNRYMCASGTSAACPHVAGAAALVWSWYPLATNLEVRQWLMQHLKDL